MSFYDFYHRFFNFRRGVGERPPDMDPVEDDDDFSKPRDSLWETGEEDSIKNFTGLFDFKVHRDPFEMHHLLEKSLSDIFSALTMLDGFLENHETANFEPPNLPAIEKNKNPRDIFLKPGYNKEDQNKRHNEKNLGELSLSVFPWMDSFFPSQSLQEKSTQPQKFSSFTSITRKTIKSSDGSVKMEEIIRTGDGSEQKTESHTILAGSHSSTFDNQTINPGLFGYYYKISDMNKPQTRYQLLEPGYEKLDPYSAKTDKDLDKQILNSGIDSLPVFTKDQKIIESIPNFSYKIFTRKTVTLPSGAVQSEEIFRNSHGTEQRTVTGTLPDGTSSKPESLLRASITEYDMLNHKEEECREISVALRSIKDFIDIIFK